MPRLDPVIQRLFTQAGGQELVLTTGAGISLRTADALVPVVKPALSTQQLISLLVELVPTDLREGFPAEGLTTFPYLSPSGAVQVKLEQVGGLLTATVARYGNIGRTALAAEPEDLFDDEAPPALPDEQDEEEDVAPAYAAAARWRARRPRPERWPRWARWAQARRARARGTRRAPGPAGPRRAGPQRPERAGRQRRRRRRRPPPRPARPGGRGAPRRRRGPRALRPARCARCCRSVPRWR